MNTHQFNDRTVSVVAGGHTGIGRAVAQVLADNSISLIPQKAVTG